MASSAASAENVASGVDGITGGDVVTLTEPLMVGCVDHGFNTCPICLCEVVNMVISTCGHTFCRSCITRHLQSNSGRYHPDTAPCPQCREISRKCDFRPLYLQDMFTIDEGQYQSRILTQMIKYQHKFTEERQRCQEELTGLKHEIKPLRAAYSQYKTLGELKAAIARCEEEYGHYSDPKTQHAKRQHAIQDYESRISSYERQLNDLKKEIGAVTQFQDCATQLAELKQMIGSYKSLKAINEKIIAEERKLEECRSQIEAYKSQHSNVFNVIALNNKKHELQQEVKQLETRFGAMRGLKEIEEKRLQMEADLKTFNERHAYQFRYLGIIVETQVKEAKLREIKGKLNDSIKTLEYVERKTETAIAKADAEKQRYNTLYASYQHAKKQLNKMETEIRALDWRKKELQQWLSDREKIQHEIDTLRSTLKYQQELFQKILKKGKVDLDEFKGKAEKAVELLLLAVTEPTPAEG